MPTARPDRTKMYGLLHDAATGAPMTRQVRILKVGIGVPVGKDIHVYINGDGDWCVETNNASKEKKNTKKFKGEDARDKAFEYYVAERKNVAPRTYPRKLAYFTFLRFAADGTFAHDFDAIDAYGPLPTEIEIIFTNNEPLDAAFQWWTAAELKCEGNGIDARRRLSLAKGQDQAELAEQAKQEGEKFFPILDGCYSRGCPYPRGEKPECKPHGRLSFQLSKIAIAFGGTCTFDTTGFRSISQMFSCIREIKSITGRGDADAGFVTGIPLMFVLRPYKTSHDGKPATQYGVSLEFRANDPVELAKLIHGHSNAYQTALMQAPPKLLTTALSEETPDADAMAAAGADETSEASQLNSEFYGNFEHPVDDGHSDEDAVDADVVPLQQPRRKSEATGAKKTSTKKTSTKRASKKRQTVEAETNGSEQRDAGAAVEAETDTESKAPAASTDPSDPGAFTGTALATQDAFKPSGEIQNQLFALMKRAGLTKLNALSTEMYGVSYADFSPEALEHFIRWLHWKVWCHENA